MKFKAYIMDSAAVNRALARISHEIIERNGDSDEICLVGIMRRGAPLADILASKIESLGVKTQKRLSRHHALQGRPERERKPADSELR